LRQNYPVANHSDSAKFVVSRSSQIAALLKKPVSTENLNPETFSRPIDTVNNSQPPAMTFATNSQSFRVDPVAASKNKNEQDKPASIRGVELAPSGRSRISTCLGFRIASTGVYLPDEVVSNKDLERLGCDSEWIYQRTGMMERRKAADHEATSDLAYNAAVDCLKRADVAAHEVDLIIVATITPDHFTPSTACIVQNRLECIAPAFDLNAACSGFVYAMTVAGQFVRSGTARNALVIGAEIMSRTVNPNDVKTYPLFGDGAGAVLIQPDQRGDQSSGLLSFCLGAEGAGGPQLVIPGGGSREPLDAQAIECGSQFLKMDGKSVFKWAVRVIRESCRDVLTHSGLTVEDIASWVLHQANIRIIDAAVEEFKLNRDRLIVNVDKMGNTSAASVPIALHDALMAGKIKPDDYVMLCGFGAGLTWATGIMRW
jgi:3-oxoacyl-[acyl-carrier-protein] synthase III